MNREERVKWFFDSLALGKINGHGGKVNCAHCALRMGNYISAGKAEETVTPVPTSSARLYTYPTYKDSTIKRSFIKDKRVLERVFAPPRSLSAETFISYEVITDDGAPLLDLTHQDNTKYVRTQVKLQKVRNSRF